MSSVMAKQSTSVILDVGPILDSTGAEYASAVIGDLTISKNGSRATMSGNTFTHAGNGHYSLTLTTTDTNTLGVIQISCNKSTYQMQVKERQIVPAMIYDAVVLGTDVLQADVIQLLGTAWLTPGTAGTPDVNTKTISAGAINSAAIATDAIDADAIKADAITEIQSGLATQTSVDAIQTDTNDIQTRLPAALVGGKMDSIAELDSASLRAALGMSAADLDTQLDAILAASGGAGTGARTVTITVNDGTTALQNAVVRFTEGSNTFRALTNASGVAVFNVDDATYTVAVTKSGYTYAGTTLIVNGTETATYSMTATNVTSPTNPDLSVIEVLCLDEDFEAASGIDVDFRMSAVATGDQNRAHPGAKKTVTSNGSGIARFEGPQGATIEWKRGTGQVWTAVTLDSDSVTNVTSLIGSP